MPKVECGDPKQTSDKAVQVPILIDGLCHFEANFIRLPDGRVSDPAIFSAGTTDLPGRDELQQLAMEAARNFRRERRANLEEMLAPAVGNQLPPPFRDIVQGAREAVRGVRENLQPVVENARRQGDAIRAQFGLPPKGAKK